MAPDLLSTIRREIDERLNELRPLLAEHQQLLVAAEALETTVQDGDSEIAATGAAQPQIRRRSAGARRTPRNSVQALKRAVPSSTDEIAAEGRADDHADGNSDQALHSSELPRPAAPSSAKESKPARAARGAAREAILAALDHGSHTLGELVVVTAMSGPNINGNLRRLLAEGAITKTEREGKAAWALDRPTV